MYISYSREKHIDFMITRTLMGINSKITKYPESRRELSFFHKLQTKACESLFNILDTMKDRRK